jgi:tetratricopeptide (TPR) repeat protein
MNVTFSPKFRSGADVIERWLLQAAQYALLLVVILVPIFFWPQQQLSIGFTKSFAALVGVSLATIIFSLFVLRIGVVRMVAPLTLSVLWGFTLMAWASALLSGDRFDAILGDTLPIGTAAFITLVTLTITAATLILDSKIAVMRFLLGFSVLALLIQGWQVLRLLLGPEFLTLGVFNSNTVSFLGSFNDVALFSGLIILISIVALLQLPIRGLALWFVGVNILLALFLLAVINFFLVWLVVGFFTLLVFLYSLTRDRLLGGNPDTTSMVISQPVLLIMGVVFAASAVFVVAGGHIGSKLGEVLSVQYMEVRPSFTTTLDIASAVYRADGALLGIGPNRFEDAWRAHKNPVINETLFWNSSFTAGSGYIPTLFVTTGLLGGILFVLFLGLFVAAGYRMLVTAGSADPFWYFVATAALTASVYVWGMAFLYVPGTTMLIMGAFFVGLALAAYGQLVPTAVSVYSFTDNRARAFVLIALVMVVITAIIAALFVVSKQFVAHAVYTSALQGAITNSDAARLDTELERASTLFESDVFINQRVQLRLGVIRGLLDIQQPSQADIERFNTAAVEALALAGQAVTNDGTNPQNHLLLGSVYGVLAIAGATSTTRELASASFARARALDPQNPEYALFEAQLSAREGNLERAREYLNQALTLKRNYVDALYLLSQVDVSQGNTEAALTSARAIITIEPKNPARYFQLGVLLLGNRDLVGAREVFSAAVALDTNFANARYLLALIELETGNRDIALEQLKVVQSTNPDNVQLSALVGQLESGQAVPPPLGITTPVDEPTVSVDGEGVTTTDTPPNTDLIVPINRRTGAPEESTVDVDTVSEEVMTPEAEAPSSAVAE